MFKYFARKRKIHNTIRELNRLSDRELSDLGISRGQIPFIAEETILKG